MRRSLLALALGVLALALLTGCDRAPAAPATPAPPVATPTPTPTPGETPSPTPTPAAAVCMEGGGFEEDGELVAASGEGDAENIGAFRWQRHDDVCERFVIDLATEGGTEAADVGEVTVELLRELGVVRVIFPRVRPEIPEETDAEFDGPFAVAAYTVRTDEFAIYVDLHVGEAVLARAFVLSSPARVVVDLVEGGPSMPDVAAREHQVVVLTPREGDASYPLEITGYARTFEANVIARIRQGGDVLVQDFTTALDWTGTWGEFTITLDEGPTGDVELFVGGESARDGSEQGVRIELTMR